jgi:hypothetical protein
MKVYRSGSLTDIMAASESKNEEEDGGGPEFSDWKLPLAFSKKRHTESIKGVDAITQTWRMKERVSPVDNCQFYNLGQPCASTYLHFHSVKLMPILETPGVVFTLLKWLKGAQITPNYGLLVCCHITRLSELPYPWGSLADHLVMKKTFRLFKGSSLGHTTGEQLPFKCRSTPKVKL